MIQLHWPDGSEVSVNPTLIAFIDEEEKEDGKARIWFSGIEDDFISVGESKKQVDTLLDG